MSMHGPDDFNVFEYRERQMKHYIRCIVFLLVATGIVLAIGGIGALL